MNEVPDSTNMIIEFFGKREAGSDQAREALNVQVRPIYLIIFLQYQQSKLSRSMME